MKKTEFFKVEDGKITRTRRHCPKCGPAVFIAEHKDRSSCGKCGYTEFKAGVKKEPQPLKVEEKPMEKKIQKPQTPPKEKPVETKKPEPSHESPPVKNVPEKEK